MDVAEMKSHKGITLKRFTRGQHRKVSSWGPERNYSLNAECHVSKSRTRSRNIRLRISNLTANCETFFKPLIWSDL